MLLPLLCVTAMGNPTELRLASLFTDSMVLQRETSVPVWGWAAPGSEVRVRASWSDAASVTRADASGRWSVRIDTPGAGGPHELVVGSEREIRLRDVLVGEVWLCSGQSNMEWKLRPGELGGVMNAAEEIAAATYPKLRHFDVENRASLQPEERCIGAWQPCTPQTAGEFSAVAYFFARELVRELDVPVGVINASWSGTRIEAWLDEGTTRGIPELAADFAQLEVLRVSHRDGALDPQVSSVLHNGMLAPLAPFAVRGFLWYQGEANRARHVLYRTMQPAFVERLRASFEGPATQPFYFVQIAPYAYEDDEGETGAMRDAQRRCLTQPDTGMAVTMDIGDPADIHPTNKQEVGRRLALWALAKTYGRADVVHSGPLYREHSLEGSQVRVHFDSLGPGLIEGGDHITGFEVAGEDRRFRRASARIDGDNVLVWSSEVTRPVAVRYGFAAASQPILFNKSWLPAAAFRTDDWPCP
jgi:sialate O-acetylesterase